MTQLLSQVERKRASCCNQKFAIYKEPCLVWSLWVPGALPWPCLEIFDPLGALEIFHDVGHWLLLHTCIFQHVRPLSTSACVTMLQMLPKMICSEELFGVVALSDFMCFGQMLNSHIPISVRRNFLTLLVR
jgi:hypothetical protein